MYIIHFNKCVEYSELNEMNLEEKKLIKEDNEEVKKKYKYKVCNVHLLNSILMCKRIIFKPNSK